MEYAKTHYLRQSHAWLIQSIELQDLYLSSKSKVDPSLLCTRPWDNIDLKAGKKKKKRKILLLKVQTSISNYICVVVVCTLYDSVQEKDVRKIDSCTTKKSNNRILVRRHSIIFDKNILHFNQIFRERETFLRA